MKKKKNKIIGILLTLCFVITLFQFPNILAANTGSATVNFTSGNSVLLGENITITMSISDISVTDPDGIGSIGGTLSYDSEYLEYVSSNSLTTGISFSYYPSTKKFAWVYSGTGIKSNTNLMSFTFKAKKEGTTSVSANGLQLSDTVPNRLTSNVSGKQITIKSETVISSNANLSALGVTGYTIKPMFQKNVTSYTLTVPNLVSSIAITGSVEDSKATVSGLGNHSLTVGSNIIPVIVTAEDGTKKTYTMNVVREAGSDEPVLNNDATLKSIYIGGYTLNPTFRKDINVYSITVGEKVGGLNVEAIATNSKSKVTVTGSNGWKYGVNQVEITVEAEDGTKNIYIINVNRTNPEQKEETVKSADNYLTDLSIKGVTLNPTFDKNKNNYNIVIPSNMDQLDISYKASSNKAKIEVTGNGNFKVGEINPVEIKVMAEDGSVRMYTLNVTKSTTSSNNDLDSLEVEGFELSPTFDKNTDEYHVKVKHDTEEISINAIAANKNAKVEISGNTNLKPGNNLVLVKVTDENGFIHLYQIHVEKPTFSILGMSLGQFLMLLLLGFGILGIIIFLILLLKRKEKPKKTTIPVIPNAPIIEVKPEFNFGSKNTSDDDVVYSHGVLNQDATIDSGKKETPKIIGEIPAEIPYDPYDDIVTKDELIDAIKEGMDTKNPQKLKMLLKQEELNRLKEALKEEEKDRWSDEK